MPGGFRKRSQPLREPSRARRFRYRTKTTRSNAFSIIVGLAGIEGAVDLHIDLAQTPSDVAEKRKNAGEPPSGIRQNGLARKMQHQRSKALFVTLTNAKSRAAGG